MDYGISESDKKHIWKKLSELSKGLEAQDKCMQLLEMKLPESLRESKQANKKTSEYRNRAKKSLSMAEELVTELRQVRDEIGDLHSNIEGRSHNVIVLTENIKKKSQEIEEHYESLEGLQEASNPVFEELTSMVDRKQLLETQIERIEELSESIEELEKKSRGLFSGIAKISKSAKELHDNLYGYETTTVDENEESTDETIRVEGLKERLDKSYEEITENLEVYTKDFTKLSENVEERLVEIKDNASKTFENYINDCGSSYNKTLERINSLLPEALTAGLASAYENKTAKEIEDLRQHKKSFILSIWSLVLISLFPFAINGIRLYQDSSLELLKLIKDMPYLIFAMMPLYIPILWVAYSSNKSYKLSKRLIEEYSHKGVVSRTFEGLANQISELDDSDISSELRTQLLFNLVAVNSENPGKLISDYNKSDHPLMDALEKSSQMANSLAKLSKIPGFSKMAKSLSDKGQAVLDIEDKKIGVALEDRKEPNDTKVTE